MTVFIYALNEPCSGPDPTAGRTRYVGKAVDPYARYEAHIKTSGRENTYKSRWIRSLLKVGKTPILEILDEVLESEWAFWECEWIRLYRALGFRLTNSTDGGDGVVNPSAEIRAKIGARHAGKYVSAETRAKISAGQVGRRTSEETRVKLRAASGGENNPNFGKHPSAETRVKLSIAHTGKHPSAETRAKMSAATTGENNPNFGKHPSDETRAKMRAAKGGENHPLYGKTRSAETRAKMSESQKARRSQERLI